MIWVSLFCIYEGKCGTYNGKCGIYKGICDIYKNTILTDGTASSVDTSLTFEGDDSPCTEDEAAVSAVATAAINVGDGCFFFCLGFARPILNDDNDCNIGVGLMDGMDWMDWLDSSHESPPKGCIGEEEKQLHDMIIPYIKMKSEFIVLIHTCGDIDIQ